MVGHLLLLSYPPTMDEGKGRDCRGLLYDPYPEGVGSGNVRYFFCTCGASAWDLSTLPGGQVPLRGVYELACCNCGRKTRFDFGREVFYEHDPYLPESEEETRFAGRVYD